MNLMIVDTTEKALNVIISTPEKDYIKFDDKDIKHNSRIMTLIDMLLKESSLSVHDIDVFSAVIGPGSFTGIRIGVTIMNAFADVTGGNRVAVNVFEMISYGEKNAIALVDARHNNYYGAEIRDFKIIRMGDYREADIDLNLINKIYRKNIDYSKALVNIVREKVLNNDYVKSLTPLYLKGSQAERELLQKSYSIIKMNDTHIHSVVQLEKALFHDAWNSELWESTLDDNNAHSFVIESNNKIYGYLSLLHIMDEMHIMRIAVSDEIKRQGYGDRLLRYAIDFSRSKGVNNITLEVRESNVAAKALYSKHGFRQVGIRKKYYEMKEDGDIYTLKF